MSETKENLNLDCVKNSLTFESTSMTVNPIDKDGDIEFYIDPDCCGIDVSCYINKAEARELINFLLQEIKKV
jgi:hypothetical protein